MAKTKDRTNRGTKGGRDEAPRRTNRIIAHQAKCFKISSSRRFHAATAVLLLVLILLLVPVFYPQKFTPDVESARINGADPVRLSRVLDFLDNFVCQYKPTHTHSIGKDNGDKIDIPGYCHPRLASSPQNRTQFVSPSNRPMKHVQPITSLFSLEHSITWWRDTLSHRQTTDKVEGGELVMRLPRPLQIWDLDALRDEFIRTNFLGLYSGSSAMNRSKHVARHKESSNPLDSGAYLAVYLLRMLHGSQLHPNHLKDQCGTETDVCMNTTENHVNEVDSGVRWVDTSSAFAERTKLLTEYLAILPTYADRIISSSGDINLHEHPITWNETILASLFPKYTHTFNLILNYQKMVQSEYDALRALSFDEFGKNVNFTEYTGMRVNVLSRAFSVMVSDDDVGPSWTNTNHSQSLSHEVESYETSNFGVRIYSAGTTEASGEFKFRSMCPLLDMYNSHPNPNVLWKYDSTTSSYVVHAQREGIPSGHTIIVSYGKYTEGHLFAKYGYVNGDGSSQTEVGLNVFHRIMGDVGLSTQYSPLPFDMWDYKKNRKTVSSTHHIASMERRTLEIQSKELLRYLMFDDGHEECIQFQNHNTTFSDHQKLKLLKFQHLKRLANVGEAWIVRLPPRDPNARPIQHGTNVSSNKRGGDTKVGINAKRILSLCRLLSLTVDDIGGHAITYLRDGLSGDDSTSSSSVYPHFRVEKYENTLEYRSLMCIVRLTDVALKRYGHFTEPNGHDEPKRAHSREWTAWYIRDGEMRLLKILRQTAASEAMKLKVRTHLSHEKIVMREMPCPIDSSLPMLQIQTNS
ncbi:hypothetical protein HJC23_013987 [Cyclotella cryptica]|uniref:SET domain-containing protein n=1 Tax=Cyclotella cryptica TaxID=29204 RepID=A0ABD3NXQ9_9STRA|eukprot:CCRYP_019233-RA/>CCRYP_019233-RA protein AED:0.05 eAED:0.05 QI:0/-1/0/1/-1/1/1/0/802